MFPTCSLFSSNKFFLHFDLSNVSFLMTASASYNDSGIITEPADKICNTTSGKQKEEKNMKKKV